MKKNLKPTKLKKKEITSLDKIKIRQEQEAYEFMPVDNMNEEELRKMFNTLQKEAREKAKKQRKEVASKWLKK